MFWDENFWETIVTNYLSAMGVAITLFLLGLGGYEAYVHRKRKGNKKFNTKSENLSVGNVQGDINVFQEVNKTPVSEQESKDTGADT